MGPRNTDGSAPAGAARILYIDDDEAFLELLGALLTRRGYRVVAMADSEAALALLRRAPADFDVVLTDYVMPAASGVAVAREVRAIRGDLPVIVVSESVRWDLGRRPLDPAVAAAVAKTDLPALQQAIEASRVDRWSEAG